MLTWDVRFEDLRLAATLSGFLIVQEKYWASKEGEGR